MPLSEMSPNIRETEPAGRKRSHDEFATVIKVEVNEDIKAPVTGTIHLTDAGLLPPPQALARTSPRRSPSLTEAGSSTPNRQSASPETPKKSSTEPTVKNEEQSATVTDSGIKSEVTTAPAAKRKRLTAAEKQVRDRELAEKKAEKEEKAAIKAVEKLKAEEEKAARIKERDEKRRKKEEDEALKKQKKETEQRRAQEAEEKKARSQKRINNFFKTPTTPQKSAEATVKTESPTKDSPVAWTSKLESQYSTMFKPFYLKKNTRMADSSTQMDEETRDVKSRILDEFISGKRQHESSTFNPVELFTPLERPSKRGRLHHPVRHIMEQVYKDAEGSASAGADETNQLIKQARKKLATVPMKIIAFSQDVRPPYYGTVTFKPFALGEGNMRKLARKPTGRRLPLDYDYESEAEWQDEEGEDLDADDEEEELEDEDDMDEFLDDSEDAGLARRVFGNTIEPNCTGLCFEDDRRRGPCEAVYEHAMEFMHGGRDHSWDIDPFSTKYWTPEPKAKAKAKVAPATEKAAKMPPPPPPADAFAALGAGAGAGHELRPEIMVKEGLLNAVKQAILDNKDLSKVGMMDVIFQRFREDVSRTEVKNTVEYIAEKKGSGRSKEWTLKSGHEITI